MKDYGKNKEPLYLKYWNVKDLYAWAISQTLPVDSFKLVEYKSQFSKDFKKKTAVKIVMKELHDLHNDLPSLTERMKFGKVKKLVANLHNKNEYAIHIRNLKEALNHKF